MAEGVLAGYPMVDIKCAVYDGSYHPVDSNEMAFKTAARIGFRTACEKAGMVLLEPMANLEVTIDEEYAGAVMGDISTVGLGLGHLATGFEKGIEVKVVDIEGVKAIVDIYPEKKF